MWGAAAFSIPKKPGRSSVTTWKPTQHYEPGLLCLSHFGHQATPVTPRRAQAKANFRLPLRPEIPSSHLAPKSPLHTNSGIMAVKTKEFIPLEHTWLSHTSAHMVCVTEQKRPNPALHRGLEPKTGRWRTPLIESRHEKEPVQVPLSGEPPEPGQRSGSKRICSSPAENQVSTWLIRKPRFRKRAWPWLCRTQR